MNESKIPVRYSKALFESAVEKKLIDKVYNDMILISELSSITEIVEVLKSPVIPPSRKKALFTGLLEGKAEKITMSLIDLLIKNGREDYLPAVARVFRTETLKHKGITETTLVTAAAIDEYTRKKVVEFVEKSFGTKADLKESTDKEIIGGFILKINDSYIDASIRNKLRKVKKGLAAGAMKKE